MQSVGCFLTIPLSLQVGGGGQKMLCFSTIGTVLFFKFYIVYSFNPTTPPVRAPVPVSQLTYIDSYCV